MSLRSLDGEQDLGAIRCWAGSAGEPLFLLVASKCLNATANAAAFEIHLPTGVPLSLPGLANYGVASYCAALGQPCAQVAANAAADVAGGPGAGYAAADDVLAGDAVRGAEPPCQQQQQQQNSLSPPSDWLDVLLDAADLIEGYEGEAASAWSWCSGAGGCPSVTACNSAQERAQPERRQQQQQQRRGLAVAPVRVTAYVGFVPPAATSAASLSPLLRVQGSAAFTAAAAAPGGAGSSSSQRPPCALSAPAVRYAAAAAAAAAAIPAAARANAATAAEALWTRRNLDAPAGNGGVALLPVDDIRLSAPAAAGMAPRQPGGAAASAGQRWPAQHLLYHGHQPSYAPQTYAHPHQQPCQQGWAWYQPCPKPQSCHAAVATAAAPALPLRRLPPSRVGLAAAAAAAGCAPLASAAMASVEVTCVGDLLRAAEGAAGCSPGGGGATAPSLWPAAPPHWLPAAHDAHGLAVGICGSRSHTGFTSETAAPWQHGAQVHGAAPAAAALPAGGSAVPCARAPLADLLPCDGVDWNHAHVMAKGSGIAHNHPLHYRSDPVVAGGARRPGPTAGLASSRCSAGPDMATAAAPAAAGAPPPLSPHWPPAAQMLLPIPFGVSQSGGGEANSSDDDEVERYTGHVVECEGADVASDAWDTDSLGGCSWEAEHGGRGGGGGRCGGGPNDYNDCALLAKCMGTLTYGTRSGGGSGGGGGGCDEGGCGLPRGALFLQSGTGGAPDACGGGAATAMQPLSGDDDAAVAAAAAAAAAAVSLDTESFQGLFEECLDDYDVYQVLCRIGGGAAAATDDGANCGACCGAPDVGCLTMRMPGPGGVGTHPDQGDGFGSSSSFAQGAERVATGARCGSSEALGLHGGRQLAGRMCA